MPTKFVGSLMGSYIQKRLGITKLENELRNKISEYNKHTGRFLIIYSSDTSKTNIPDIAMRMDDYYTISDILKNTNLKELDFYIQTPGGSGETAEEIARFLHKKFEHVNFIVAGEAKSAGTILVMSGNEIYMTQTASLGPIDAQMSIGRGYISAHDYMEWVKEKEKEATEKKQLNHFDAVMISQISPGEIKLVHNALEFAKDLVKEWIPKYKFKDWVKKETSGDDVTEKMKSDRAEEIADELCNHSKWRSHGRSLKIDDLTGIGLKINRLEDDQKLYDIIEHIHVITRLMFATSPIYKIFSTEFEIMSKQAVSKQDIREPLAGTSIEVTCPKCGKIYKFFLNLTGDKKFDDDMIKKEFLPIPNDKKYKCPCNYELDLSGIINDIMIKL